MVLFRLRFEIYIKYELYIADSAKFNKKSPWEFANTVKILLGYCIIKEILYHIIAYYK